MVEGLSHPAVWSLDCLVVWLFGRLVGCLFVWSAASLSRCPCSCPRGPQAAALLVRILLCTLTRWLFPPSCPVVVRAQYDPVNTSDPGHTFSTSVSLCFHPLVFIASHLLLCLLLHVLVFVRLLVVLVFGRVFCHDSVFCRLRSPVLSRRLNYRCWKSCVDWVFWILSTTLPTASRVSSQEKSRPLDLPFFFLVNSGHLISYSDIRSKP